MSMSPPRRSPWGRRSSLLYALALSGALWACEDEEGGDGAPADAGPARDMRVTPDMNTETPDMSTPTPDMDVPEPDMDVPEPDMDVPEPDMEMPEPDMDVPEPDMDVPEPDMDVPGPDMDIPRPPQPEIGAFVITEIMYNPHDPLADDDAEWFEVYNAADFEISLEGCSVSDSNPDSAEALGPLTVPAGGYALFVASDDQALNGGLQADATFSFALNNDGDAVTITCGDDVIDTVSYGVDAPWPAAARQRSIQIHADLQDSNEDGGNWCYGEGIYFDPAGSPAGQHQGTPGVANPQCPPPDVTVDLCRLQAPLDVAQGAGTELTVQGRAFEAGITDLSAGVDGGLLAELGYGPDGSHPAGNAAWTWSAAAPAPLWDDAAAGEVGFDEYVGAFIVPGAGSYDFAFRFSRDAGATWLYCDRDAGDGADGSEDGYQPAQAGQLTSQDSPCDNFTCDAPPAPICAGDGVTVITAQAPGVCAVEGGEAQCDYPTVETDCSLGGGRCEAGACVDLAPLAGPGDVVITEIMYDPHDPLADDSAEWFEIQNVSGGRITLNGCTLVDSTPENAELVAGIVLEAGAYGLLAASADQALNGGLNPDAVFSFGLNNGGDTLTLTCADQIVDTVAYDDQAPWPVGAQRQSIALDPGAADNTLPAHWCGSEDIYYQPDGDPVGAHRGTPGAANPACPVPDPCEPNPCDAPPAALCDGDTAVTYAPVGLCANDGAGGALCSYEEIRTACEGGDLCEAGACTPPNTRNPRFGELILTEIMYDPHDPLADDSAEWLEIHNATDDALNLSNCDVTVNGNPVNAGAEPLAPRGYRLLAKSADPALNGGLDPDVIFGFAVGNGGATVNVICGGQLIDNVNYDDGAPWPLDARRHSVSLSPDHLDSGDNDDGENWCYGRGIYFTGDASIEDHHGTPGAPNPPCEELVDFCRLQFPLAVEAAPGDVVTVYGRIYEDGITDRSGAVDPAQTIQGQLGYGPDGSDPAGNGDWSWINAAANANWDGPSQGEDNNDEYQADLIVPDAGLYDFAFRFTADGGRTWSYCDGGDAGSSDGYSADDAGALTSAAAVDPCDPNPCDAPPAASCLNDGVAQTYAAVGACTDDGGVASCEYEMFEEICDPDLEICAAGACAALAGRAPVIGDLRITEIMYTTRPPLADDTAEWFELYNASEDILDLEGCALVDGTPANAEIIGALTLPPQQSVLFGRSDDEALNGGISPVYLFSFALDDGDTLSLSCGGGEIVTVTYGAGFPWPDATPGQSISLDADATASGPADGWCLSDAAYFTEGADPLTAHTGTPGEANPYCPTAVDFCRLQFPTDVTVEAGAEQTFYGRLYQAGYTDASNLNDPAPRILAGLGYGPDGSEPAGNGDWIWGEAEPNPGWDGNNAGVGAEDEYQYTLTAPEAGTYDTAFRFSVDGGQTWTYCDGDGPGNTNGYQVEAAGHMLVNAQP